MSRYTVLTASAHMPRSCWGRYRRVAVVKLDGSGITPRMISERAKGIEEVVRTWERLNVGTTHRSAYHRALAEADAMCAQLNDGV